MAFFENLAGIFLHADKYIDIIIQNYGVSTYLILFLIVFLETGLVVTPFLPGDSLIFVAGTFAGKGLMNVVLLFFILALAAILGDTLNYAIGNYFGKKIFLDKKYIRKDYMKKTEDFYKKYGGKTIIIARFLPIVRTFAPFIAGVGRMDYLRFLAFNVVGGILWVGLFLFSGFYFGRIPFVKENLTLIVFIIIALSLVPPLFEYIKSKIKKGDRIISS